MARLVINLLGAFQASLDSVLLTGFDSDKTRALLAYLAVESNRSHRRETLTGLLWPNVTETSARQSLSQALFNLRRMLGDGKPKSGPTFILATRDTVQFNRESDYALDTERLEVEDFRSGESLVSVYPAPLLDGFTLPDAEEFEAWLLLQRESLHRRAIELFDKAAGSHIAAGNYTIAIALAQRQLELDPWREEAHNQLMRAYALNGQRIGALAQFERCKQVLKQALGVEPSAGTKALADDIRRDALNPSQRTPADAGKASARPIHSGLPQNLTPFVGREHEVRELSRLIADPGARLITLVAAGGMGKTRLAIEAATQMQSQFPHGAAYVPLASASSAGQVLPALAQALGITLVSQAEPKLQVFSLLERLQLLCVLDNVEHLLTDGSTTDLLIELLQAAPNVKLLVTSREALNLQGEWVFALDGLGDDAQTLFSQTARRAHAQWRADEADVAHIKKICQLVGGMPLGVELAASWSHVLSCAEIVEEIEQNIAFLATTTRHADERHRSIMVVFDASWRLLTPEERRMMEGLSVFRGGFTREAAKDVAGASLLVLSSLVSKSLVRRAKTNRYDLHELVRQYAAQRVDLERQETLRDKHQRCFVRQADTLEPAWLGRDQSTWLPPWFAELDNLRLAIAWAFDERATPARRAESARLLSALPSLWRSTGELGAARAQLGQLLGFGHGRRDELPQPLRAWSLLAMGYMALWQADADIARSCLEEGIGLMQQPVSANPFGVALGLLGLGEIASLQSDYPKALSLYQDSYERFEAIQNMWGVSESLIGVARHTLDATFDHKREMLERSLAMKRDLGDDRGVADVLSWLSVVTQQMGDFETTRRLHQDSLALQRTMRDTYGAARTLNRMAEMLRQQGQYDEAMPYYRESLKNYQELGIPQGIFFVQHNMGHVLLIRGDVQAALRNFNESLKLCLSLGDKEGIALALAGLGGVVVATRRAGVAVVYLAAAQALLQSINYYFESTDRIDYERNLASARAILSEAEFEAAWAKGCTADYEQIAQSALRLTA